MSLSTKVKCSWTPSHVLRAHCCFQYNCMFGGPMWPCQCCIRLACYSPSLGSIWLGVPIMGFDRIFSCRIMSGLWICLSFSLVCGAVAALRWPGKYLDQASQHLSVGVSRTSVSGLDVAGSGPSTNSWCCSSECLSLCVLTLDLCIILDV